MKNFIKLPVFTAYLILLVSCTKDSPVHTNPTPQAKPQVPVDFNDRVENNDGDLKNRYFAFLDGDGSFDTYIDMPVESSPKHLFIGRWQMSKFGLDEYGNGNIKYDDFEDFEHKNCGQSFLQFNNDGVVFENYYHKETTCNLNVEIDNWELIGENRLKIYVYDFIYLVKVTETELVLKYDWSPTAWGPMQVYYHYERILPNK